MKNEEMYMHEVSGDVASLSDWESEFNSMDVESWFGLPAEECEALDWLEDVKLIKVVRDDEGEWVEA